MPPKFIEELNAAIASFEDAIKAYAEKKSIHVTATVSIESTMEKAMDALYRLDGIVPNKIKKDQALLREWDVARRVASARSPRNPDSPPARQTEQPSAATAA